MTNSEIAEKLGDLMKVDVDAYHGYDQAIQRIEHAEIKQKLTQFRMDHERHANDLAAEIRRLGETPPEFSRDFKGYLLEGFAALRSITGTEGSLKALKSAEEYTNREYSEAVRLGFPSEIADLLERNYRDEQNHLSYVNQAINNRIWEKEPARGY